MWTNESIESKEFDGRFVGKSETLFLHLISACTRDSNTPPERLTSYVVLIRRCQHGVENRLMFLFSFFFFVFFCIPRATQGS